MIKWIICDLDQSLLAHSKDSVFIEEKAIEAINDSMKEKKYFSIATGRHYKDVINIVNNHNFINKEEIYIVGMNGNQIYSPKEKKLIYENVLIDSELNKFQKVIDYMEETYKERYLTYGYNKNDEMFFIDNGSKEFKKMKNHLESYESNKDLFNYTIYKKFEDVNGVYKFSFYFMDLIDIDKLINKLYEISDELTYVTTGDYYIEIVNKKTSKHQALKFINENIYKEINFKEETIIFGDSGNDYEMMINTNCSITNNIARKQIQKIAFKIYEEKPSVFVEKGIKEFVLKK